MLNSFYCIYSDERGDCKCDNDIPFCASDFCCVYFNDGDYCIYKDNCPRNRHGYWIKCTDEEKL